MGRSTLKLTSIKTFRIPDVPGFKSNEYIKDGFGSKLITIYASLLVRVVMKYCNNNLQEASRIMGWTEQQVLDDIEAYKKRIDK